MQETSLFEWGEARARTTDPETSHNAAKEVEGTRAARLEKAVIDCLRDHPSGLTTHEIAVILNEGWGSVTPRMRPLRGKGFVVATDERRLSPFNKNCIVWKVSPEQQ